MTNTLHNFSNPAKTNKIAKYMVAGVFFFCPFRQLRFIPFLAPQDIFLFVALIVLFLDRKTTSYRKNFTKIFAIGFFLFTYFCFASLIASKDPVNSIANYAKISVAYLFLPIAISLYVRTYGDINFLFNSFAYGAVVASFFGSILKVGISDERSPGFAGHPVYNGILTSIAICILLTLAEQNLMMRVIQYLLAVFLLFELARSASSTGLLIVASLCVFKIVEYFRPGHLPRFIAIAFGVCASSVLVWNSTFFNFARTRLELSLNPTNGFSTNGGSGFSTLEGRLFSIRESWIRIQDNPVFGQGLDPAGRNTSINLEPHNFIFLAWQTGGLVSLFLSLTFLAFLYHFFWQALLKRITLEASVIFASGLAIMSSPLIYERSILATLYLAFISIKLSTAKQLH